jgi:hypothetical protein
LDLQQQQQQQCGQRCEILPAPAHQQLQPALYRPQPPAPEEAAGAAKRRVDIRERAAESSEMRVQRAAKALKADGQALPQQVKHPRASRRL